MEPMELKQRQADVWGSAPFELVAPTLTGMHEAVLDSVNAGPGDRWLDVACGTGELARMAVRTGAEVVGADSSPALIATAERLSEGLGVRFEVADVEALPYDDGAFDIVTSTVGAIFAPHHEAVADQLSRVTRLGGRLAMTAWIRNTEGTDPFDVFDSYAPPPPPEAADLLAWGEEEHASDLLDATFELTVTRHISPWRSESAATMVEQAATAFGPIKTLLANLPADRAASLRSELIERLDQHRTGDTEVTVDRQYVLIVGVRR